MPPYLLADDARRRRRPTVRSAAATFGTRPHFRRAKADIFDYGNCEYSRDSQSVTADELGAEQFAELGVSLQGRSRIDSVDALPGVPKQCNAHHCQWA